MNEKKIENEHLHVECHKFKNKIKKNYFVNN
jgi:hypothetical protein